MSILTPAGAEHLSRLLPMIAAYHEFKGIQSNDSRRRAALEPLLRGTPLGSVWLIGPKMAPVGYVAVGMGWSIELGGPDAFVDELFIREAVRGRGMGAQALDALATELAARGVVALHLEVAGDDAKAQSFYARRGFARRDNHTLMTRRL
ncbi:GNAT family N-acetyltransferase [Frigidibacter sp. ROC022]|uniref:GNAT family N-acetyltransferase n=1 Tax=Frigidibacter sp. ROC022 TaxID=2971796 RepID=UPI00215AF158|nr:GNAT family N-acetyltransferase [Frigidibacter sp. ROC022]MCR8723691.1 GNAT family N-acetyltransferase [Frigidibacter sp. ROC022]